MTDLLVRLFIKNSADVSDPAVRQQYGLLGSGVGIAVNVLLFAAKFFAGLITGSVAVMADAFNNLSDAGSSVVTLIGFRLSGQKPDKDHPFGHGRIEYISGLFVAMAILLMGFELARDAVSQILHPSAVDFSLLSAVILALSIAAKLFLCHFNRRLGSRIHSVSMQATSADSMGDAIATSAVLAGSLIGRFFEINIDGWLGVCVALVILRAGWEAARDTITPLLGTTPDPELVSNIAKTVQAHPEVIGIHDLVIHDYGPGRVMISLHAEVNANGDILTLHDAIDNIERELAAKFNCAAVIHMDPVECDDAKTNDMRQKVACLAAAIDPDITIHDFRMVTGPSHTNLIFDMVLPMDSRLTPQEARDSMEKAVSVLEGPCFAVITVDRPML
ncbi:MAG: cation diffusion facilitator family transporter [Clostridia bacterium]|nr:cation diffusion facilitator family transporter [Clostridia bacterium]